MQKVQTNPRTSKVAEANPKEATKASAAHRFSGDQRLGVTSTGNVNGKKILQLQKAKYGSLCSKKVNGRVTLKARMSRASSSESARMAWLKGRNQVPL